ncbi:SDR family NAD(P)-dependent oxidoreductase [Rhodoblastus sp.]|uniref:SDR family NAD(P)-dependent oxidoreductase n=1 Tax=Rhodoblastus sp. TaxID=1962975 RepID=UPI0035AFA3D6
MKTALVTGATSRLGAPLARSFARAGYRVILHANSARDAAQALAEALQKEGAAAEVLIADFADRAATARFCDTLTERFGAPDVIVNNASIFTHDFPGRGEPDLLAASLAVHAEAPFRIIEAAARAKRPEALLTVFNILDQKLINPNPDYFSYTLGKAALLALTELWRTAGRPDVRAFGLLPGLMFPSGPQTEARFAVDSEKIPTGRATPAQDICAAIHFFLARPDLPGQLLPIDGGEHLVPRRRDIAFE